jgi:SpoVK/Ycf46/Vps4 family AAA+-type ATPase
MATAEQIKALLASYAEGDESRFFAVSMQVAAHAARKGQAKLAEEIRTLVDRAKERRAASETSRTVPITRAIGELSGILAACYPKTRLSDMVLDPEIKDRLRRVIVEYRQQHKLRGRGLSARRKLLLVGPPGSGKTMTASALAGELNLPLLTVQLHVVITKFMGETAAKLRLVFDQIAKVRAVYFFDEFDAIGGHRDRPNDVGEIRRVLNSFLQFIEQDDSDSLVLAATNHVGMLDRALFRRFDDVVQYMPPNPALVRELIENRLAMFGVQRLEWGQIVGSAEGLSYAEIARACEDAARRTVLEDDELVSTESLLAAVREKQKLHKL